MNCVRTKSFKYQISTLSGCKDNKIWKFDFVTRAQFLYKVHRKKLCDKEDQINGDVYRFKQKVIKWFMINVNFIL